MASETVTTRILIISDTHCAQLSDTNGDGSMPAPTPPFKSPLPSADLLIHCGDLTKNGIMDEYDRTLDMLQEIVAPVKLVIAGNHDLSLDRHFVRTHRDRYGSTGQADLQWKRARNLWTAVDGRAKKDGITFLDEGLHQIDLPNGAHIKVYASPYTPEFYDWGFPYERNEDRFNNSAATLSDAKSISDQPIPAFSHPDGPIDILVTHGPPYQRLDKTDKGDFAGCPHLLRALMHARPLLHCFGHIHEGWGAEVVTWSDSVDGVASSPMSIAEWRDGGWRAGIRSVRTVPVDNEASKASHAALLDLSTVKSLDVRGSRTALINAAIMDAKYRPVNAPWLVVVDLPRQP